MVPKVLEEGLIPAQHDDRPELGWCPPGHGDLYTAIKGSGLLDQLIGRGIEYAFVSNADNLGAALDPSLLGYMVAEGLDFMLEAADRTAADRKGGHLCRLPDGRLALRESAQCPPEEADAFQDIDRHRYFNTNNLWVHLPTLRSPARRARRLPAPAHRRQSENSRSPGPGFAQGLPTRNSDGNRDFAFPESGSGSGPQASILAGQEHQRSARRPLRRLRSQSGRPNRPQRRPSRTTGDQARYWFLQDDRRLRAAVSKRSSFPSSLRSADGRGRRHIRVRRRDRRRGSGIYQGKAFVPDGTVLSGRIEL